MTISMTQAILATISYRGIFDYPLTHEEVYDWLIKLTGKKEFDSALATLIRTKKVCSAFLDEKRWIIPAVNTKTILQRKRRAIFSRAKWTRARVVSRLLSLVATVSFVGVTGGLSVHNVDESDDIDFFLIVEPGALWVSRFCVVLVTEFFGVRRRPGAVNVKDTICLNFFLTKDHLSLEAADRDLFSAYEVLQCVPLYDRGGVYKEFLEANSWVKDFLPNAWKRKNDEWRMTNVEWGKEKLAIGMSLVLLKLFEYPVKIFQMWYMRKRRTTEIVTDTILRFHPRDMRGIVKKKLTRRLKRYKIPLDTIFYSG